MNLIKIIVAILITMALLFVARKASQRVVSNVSESVTAGELTLQHVCSHIARGDTASARLDVRVDGGLLPDGSVIALYFTPRVGGERPAATAAYRRGEALVVPGEGLVYRATVPNQGRGTEFAYYFQLESSAGAVVAALPSSVSGSGASNLWFRFEGEGATWLLVTHIAGMFGAFLLMVLAFMTACENLRIKPVKVRLGKQVLWSTIILFMGTFPIGIWLEYQVYGTYWTGIPLGRDITDSKALIVFVYWLFLLIMLKGSALAAEPRRDLVKPTVARILTIVGVLISIGLYLIPHSSGNF
jgi:hypothetical protein